MQHSASTSTIEPRPQPLGWDYEVFLSFRGTDTRTGFTDYLYNDLIDAGIRAFRDNEELRVGEEIGPELLGAIRSSKISIPIFSKGYASSKWCLMELAHILECKKSCGQMVFPIFYDVEPWDVRHQGGTYEAAFLDHEKRFDDVKVKQWRETLNEVARLKGLELKNIFNGHEGSLVKMLVTKVWRELKKSNSAMVSESLVGIDCHVEEMKKLLDINSRDVRMIGIHGMGGIGKTTLSRVIYNHYFERFEYCCFLANARECSSQHNGLVGLQNYMISSILKRESLSVATVDQGCNVIRETFCNKKVLIVLDDVDRREQLDALAQNHAWFGFGSRIIVTTRNKEILDEHLIDGIYQPKEMNAHQALQLLCKHAFKSNHPPEAFLKLSINIASTAAGLPLALEVTGSFLCGKSKEVWEHTFDKLKSIPHDRVQEKLRISYDALNHEQKQIFLDIACLFNGADKRTAIHMWDDCGFYPEYSIEVLILMSLVKVGEDNELIMHDQLRDLGREIVRQENFIRPEKRSRLWSPDEALEVLQRCQVAKEVEAIYLASGKSSLTSVQLEKLPNLRFLQIDGANLNGDFKGLFQRLRWLRWHEIPGNSRVKNLDLENLTILDLSRVTITGKKLKVLNLSDCYNIGTLDFSAYMTLEQLKLNCCPSLVNITPSIWHLKNLKRLDISCTLITELPESIGMLQMLEELHAGGCHKLAGDVPVNIGNLKCLRILDLSCNRISSLPTTVKAMLELKTLYLHCTWELLALPELPRKLTHLSATCRDATSCSGIWKLEQLEALHLYHWPELLQFPKETCAFSRLYEMKLRWCCKLQFISGLPASLVKLEVENCHELVEIRGLENLKLLEHLCVSDCEKLSSLDGSENLTSLTELVVCCCARFQRLPDFSNLKELQSIRISLCTMDKIQGLEKCQSLVNVELSTCTEIQFLSVLQQVSNLEKLQHYNCSTFDDLEHGKILRILEGIEGPCKVHGKLSRPPSHCHKRFEISFQRNSSVNFVHTDDDGSAKRTCLLVYSDKDGTVSYRCANSDEDDGGDRQFLYARCGSPFAMILQYEGKQSGSSFLDYLSIEDELYCKFCRTNEEASFEIKIKPSKFSRQELANLPRITPQVLGTTRSDALIWDMYWDEQGILQNYSVPQRAKPSWRDERGILQNCSVPQRAKPSWRGFLSTPLNEGRKIFAKASSRLEGKINRVQQRLA